MSRLNNSQYGFMTTTDDVNSHRDGATVKPIEREVVMAINISKFDKMDIGIAILDFKISELFLVSFSDSPSFVRSVNQLDIYQPTTVIIPDLAQFEKLKYVLLSNLNEDVNQKLGKVKIFDSVSGAELLKQHSLNDVKTNDLMTGAAGALIATCMESRLMKSTSKYKTTIVASGKFVLIDSSTIKDLELVSSSNDKGLSFFSFLNRCTTKMGQRLLRTSILQPLTDIESIKLRLESVNELTSQENILITIKTKLKQLSDLDTLFSYLLDDSGIPEQRINNIILLKTNLLLVLELKDCLNVTSPILQQIKEIFQHQNIEKSLNLIDKYINEDCRVTKNNYVQIAHQRANAIKSGLNGLLDVSRSVREKILEEVNEYVQKLIEQYELNLDYRYDKCKRFYLRIKTNDTSPPKLPEEFINIIHKKHIIECTTIDLLKQGSRLYDIESEINVISGSIIQELYDQSQDNLPIFFMISESIAILDLLCSFASFINEQKGSYTCPEFGNYTHIRQSRHPILETLKNVVPNDYSCVPEISRFQIITGANMSGKSIYIKQIAYILIMAQMGLYVPADYAIIKIQKSIFSRLSSDADINVSTFANEMNDMNTILKNADDSSLVLIDELGRGSSLRDGFAVCLAILDHLTTLGATVFTTTHFHEIAEILGNKSCVLSSNMKTTEQNGKFEYQFKLEIGKIETERYGIKYAELSQILPEELINFAKDLIEPLKSKITKSDSKLMSKRRKLVLELYFALSQLKKLDCDNNYKIDLLRTLQTRFVEEINEATA
ncbi:MSH4 [Candida pseudojiufengensis]|uniref:MSH4 n=1 Tax=Candida pseudojiufengensis TaxID=497109 RepID=UPI002225343A|nr:MSH4 [Candida pseudojiufengensis]KAI5966880.1 MSH4 [Candida pseudojiufengensis]